MVYEAAETLGEDGAGDGVVIAGGGLVAGGAPGVGAGVTANATLLASNNNIKLLAIFFIIPISRECRASGLFTTPAFWHGRSYGERARLGRSSVRLAPNRFKYQILNLNL
ncbi:MAG TPA: hypothetical protein VFB72_03715 [Verrucomicrobiae bacterium]|nr:hypothetical protein [Verrucomicrobiae bacterium]